MMTTTHSSRFATRARNLQRCSRLWFQHLVTNMTQNICTFKHIKQNADPTIPSISDFVKFCRTAWNTGRPNWLDQYQTCSFFGGRNCRPVRQALFRFNQKCTATANFDCVIVARAVPGAVVEYRACWLISIAAKFAVACQVTLCNNQKRYLSGKGERLAEGTAQLDEGSLFIFTK